MFVLNFSADMKIRSKNKEIVFENGVKNIQAAAYNGTRTVHKL